MKRQANVLSALIQNFDTAEKAIEASANSAGSALRENEVYLDSIQGRIDLFNNAVQSMWKNTLDSDVVKGFVNLGTELVKIIDKIGLLQSLLIALATYSMIKNKMGPIAFLGGISDIIRGMPKKIAGFISGLTGMSAATSAYTAETLSASVANSTLSATEAASIATKNGLTLATTSLTATEAAEMLTKAGVTKAEALSIVTKLGLTKETKVLTAATVQQAIADGTLTASQGAAAMAMFGASGAAKGLTASLMGLWTALWPILAVMAGVAAIYGIVKLVDHLVVTTEELQEELDGLKSELQDIQSELDSVNSELETTQDRMAELLALPSLSFTEQEELDRLREQNEELERRERLLKAQEEREKKRIAEKAVDTINSQLSDKSYNGDFWDSAFAGLDGALTGVLAGAVTGSVIPGIGTAIGAVLGGVGGLIGGVGAEHLSNRISTEDKLNEEIESYESLISKRAELEKKLTTASDEGAGLFGWGKSEYDKTKEELEKLEKEIGETETYIDETLGELGATLDGVEYGYGADEALDKYYNALYKWEIEAGTIGAGSDGLAHIFGRPEHEAAKEGIDNYVKLLKNGDESAKEEIEKIIKNNDALVADIQAMGLEISDAVDYFTMDGSGLSADIIANYEKGFNALEKFKNNAQIDFTNDDGTTENIGFDNLFDAEGEILSGQISKVMQGADETTRQEFEKLMQAVKDGKYNIEDEFGNISIDWESVTKSWNISGGLRVVAEEMERLSAINIEMFPGLEDEIDGIIDSFSELISAVSHTVDAFDTLEQARADEADSGSVSLETLEKLMQSTDNYADLIEVDETGAIHLATDAQDILVQEKIDTIKKNAELALSSAKMRLEEAKHNQQIYTESSPAQEVLRSALAEVGGAAAFVTSLWGDLTSGNLDGAWERAKTARNNAIVTKKNEYASQAAQAATSVAEAEKAVADAEKMKTIADGLTPDNIKSRFKSSENSTVKDVENDKFQQAMDYWENRIGANQAKYEQIQNEIDLLEAKGMRAGEEYYREQIELENERKSLLEQQKAEALTYLGTLNEGSDEWWEVANTINDIEGELDDVIASVQELNDAIGQIRWDGFEQLHDRFSNLTTDLENIRDILSNEDMFDDEGNFTKEGIANLATYIQELEIYKNALADVQEELADFQQGYEGNEDYFASIGIDSEQEYYDKLVELTDKQDEYTKVVKESEQSVVEMYENQIDAIEDYIGELIDGYNDYIDVVKESLDAERDLYEFKKKIKNQTKDIASLERRIASLSGSTNASDIAERRKLEAELYEAKEGLNDTYYDHAKDSQSQALDEEAQAYEESMNKYVEGLRTTLEEATANMSTFLSTVTNLVMQNAGSIESTFNDTGLALDSAIVDPWTKAAEAMVGYEEDALGRMNDWTKAGENGYFYNFSTEATNQLKSPWSAGTTAVNNFVSSVKTAMGEVSKSVQSNVDNNIAKLNSLTSGIKDTDVKVSSSGDNSGGNNISKSSGTTTTSSAGVAALQEVLNIVFNAGLTVDGKLGPATTSALKKAQSKVGVTVDGKYGPATKKAIEKYIDDKIASWRKSSGSSSAVGQGIRAFSNAKAQLPLQLAKGTMGLTKDQLAITDESWIGEEITLAAGKNGQLQYLKKGSAVMPADISANLVEWGKLNPNMLNVGGGANINMISNAINKPEINLDIAEFLHVDKVDKDTMPELEKFVDKKMNDLVRQLNYSIKKFK